METTNTDPRTGQTLGAGAALRAAGYEVLKEGRLSLWTYRLTCKLCAKPFNARAWVRGKRKLVPTICQACADNWDSGGQKDSPKDAEAPAPSALPVSEQKNLPYKDD